MTAMLPSSCCSPEAGRKVVQSFDLRRTQLDMVSGGVLLDAGDPFGARNRSNVVTLRDSQANATCAGVHPLRRNGLDLVNNGQVAREVLASVINGARHCGGSDAAQAARMSQLRQSSRIAGQ